jgi:hypothetical protein
MLELARKKLLLKGQTVPAAESPAVTAVPRVRRYRTMSDGRRGLHEALTQLVLGEDALCEVVREAAAKSARMRQRPQVASRRQALPTKNRGKKLAAT